MYNTFMRIEPVQIYKALQKENLLQNKPKYWWPNVGSFEVVVGALLTQNTKWENVERSLDNLKGNLELERFIMIKEDALKEAIRPSGFFNQKAPRLLALAKNIKEAFGNFERFKEEVDRTWLLAQKGVGKETADSILCYGCMRDVMVVDSYTKRLLARYGVRFEEYDGYKEFLENGLRKYYHDKKELFEHFAWFHGMIVEYNKRYKLPRA